ncbi:Hypothetical protein CINCED_3A012072 [Cinara cedri]|uniref:DUF4485 domain-containing protein n=1 Tax=Cinara cedri TaxID=506608 RepID=A0A5E4N7F8_9HEMI|nr:Hypothetical protein CINCED_3A012072 [Cinara cedri]
MVDSENVDTLNAMENLQEQEDLEDEYQFFRSLVKSNIFKLTSGKEQRVMCTWLHNCDNVIKDKSIKCGTIKIMLLSLQHPEGPLNYFKQTDQTELPSDVINTLESLNKFLNTTLNAENDPKNVDDESANTFQNIVAAVSADLTSFASTYVDHRTVQVFYARSDHVINTWCLPEQVQFPLDSYSSSRWESAMSTRPITRIRPASHMVQNHVSSELSIAKSETKRKCADYMTDQEELEGVQGKFIWYEHSRLDGSLKPMNEISIDKDTCLHEKNQLNMDERAISVVSRVYPGHLRMILDPVLIAEVTGIHLNQPAKDLTTHETTLDIEAMDCIKTSGEITLSNQHRPNAGEDRNFDAELTVDETTVPESRLNIGEFCGQSDPRSEQDFISIQEISNESPNDRVDQNSAKMKDTDRNTTSETKENVEEMCKQKSESCSVSKSTDSVVNAEDRPQDGEDSREDQVKIDTILIEVDGDMSHEVITPDIVTEFCEQKPCSEPSNCDSLGNPEEQPKNESDQCADTMTIETDHSNIIPEVQPEIINICRQVSDNCWELLCDDSVVASDLLANAAEEWPNDRQDQCADIIKVEVDRDIIQNVSSDISELCLKVSEICDSLVNPKDEGPDIGKAQCVDSITMETDRGISHVGSDIREFYKQNNKRQTIVVSESPPWQVYYCTGSAGSSRASLHLSPATVEVRRSSNCMHNDWPSSVFNTSRPRATLQFRRRYYLRFRAGSDNPGRRWLSAGNDRFAQMCNNGNCVAQRPAIWEGNNQQPLLPPFRPYRNTSTPNTSPRRSQQPSRRITDHGFGQMPQPYNNPPPFRQPGNNQLPVFPPRNNLRRDRRATCTDLPTMNNARPCTRRYTYDILPEQSIDGNPNATRHDSVATGASRYTYDILPEHSIGSNSNSTRHDSAATEAGRYTTQNPVEPLENYLNADMAIPRNIAVPECPFVRIDENARDRNTPEHWRNPFVSNDENGNGNGSGSGNAADSWVYQGSVESLGSLGSESMSIDVSPVLNDDNEYFQDADDPFAMQQGLREAPVHRLRTGSAGHGPSGRRQPDSFFRNTR